MHEMTRNEYIKTHGIDPEPVMQSVNKWRENQVRLWARQYGTESEVDEWIKRLSRR
jgi:aryl carrier-like protein